MPKSIPDLTSIRKDKSHQEQDWLRTVSLVVLNTIGWSIGSVVVLLFGTFLWFRFLGIPESWQNKIRDELRFRDIHLTYRQLYIDRLGRLVIKNARLYNPANPDETLLKVTQLRCAIEWLAWWRGEPFLEGIEIQNANIEIPIYGNETLDLRRVEGKIGLEKEGGIRVETLGADLFKVRLHITGRVMTPSFLAKTSAPGSTGTSSNFYSIAQLWKNTESFFNELEVISPLQLNIRLEVNREHPEAPPLLEANLNSAALEWRGVKFASISGDLFLNQDQLFIPNLTFKTIQGDIRLALQANLPTASAIAVIESRANPRFLAPLTKDWLHDLLQELKFEKEPFTRCEIDFNWRDTIQWHSQVDINWQNFTAADSRITSLQVPLALEPNRFLIPEASLVIENEETQFRLIYDHTQKMLKGACFGRLNPTRLKSFLPSSIHPFLNSCQFSDGIQCNLLINGNSFEKGEWKLGGSIGIEKTAYKGVAIEQIKTDIETDGINLRFTNLYIQQAEGSGTAAELNYHFPTKVVTIKKGITELHVQKASQLFGGKFETYCEPYRFKKPPHTELEGKIDLGGGINTDIKVKARGGSMDYPFLGIIIPFHSVDTELYFHGQNLTVNALEASLHDGRLIGNGRFDLSKPKTSFVSNFKMDTMNFSKIMTNFFDVKGVSGVFNGNASISGLIGDPYSLQGEGKVDIQEGYLVPIPFLGGLSPLLGSIIPDFGYAKSKNASASFTVANGVIHSEDGEMRSTTFTLIGNGTYHFVRDQLDMNARVNIRGPIGMVLFPVSKLFEYHGVGSLRNPQWSPKILGN